MLPKNRRIYITVVISSLLLVAIIYVVLILFQSYNKVNNTKMNDKDTCNIPKLKITKVTTKKSISDKKTDLLFKDVGTQQKPADGRGSNALFIVNHNMNFCDYNSTNLGESCTITNETQRKNEDSCFAPTYTKNTKTDQIFVDNTTGGQETNFIIESNGTKEINCIDNQNQTCEQIVNGQVEVLQVKNTIRTDQIDVIIEFIEANKSQNITELIEQVKRFIIHIDFGQPEMCKQFTSYLDDYNKKAENNYNNDVTNFKFLMKNFFGNLKKKKISYENTNALSIPLVNENGYSNLLDVHDNLNKDRQFNKTYFTDSKECNLIVVNDFAGQDNKNIKIGQINTVNTNMRQNENVVLHSNCADESQIHMQNKIADNIQDYMGFYNIASNNPQEKNNLADAEKISTYTNDHNLCNNQLTINAEINNLPQKSGVFEDVINQFELRFEQDPSFKTYSNDVQNIESTVDLHLDTLDDQKASFNQKTCKIKRKSEQSSCDYATSENNKSALDKYLNKKVELFERKIKRMFNDKNNNKKHGIHTSYDCEEFKPLLSGDNSEDHICTCYDSKERYKINSYSSINLKNHYLALPQKKYINIDIRQKYYTEITLETCQENLEVIKIILMKLISIDGCRFMDLFKLYLQHILDNIDNYYLIPNKMCNDKRRKILYIQDNLIDRWSKKFKPQTYYSCCHKAERFDIYITFYIDEIILGKKKSLFLKENNYKYMFLLKKNKIKETPVYYYL